MIKAKSIMVWLFAGLCLCVAACGKGEQEEVSEADFAREFLTVYWTQDYEERYSLWQEGREDENIDLQNLVTNYYETFEEYVTDDELRDMMSNRVPYKYEELAALSEATYTLQEIQLEKGDAGMYHYEITFLWEQEGMDAIPVCTTGDVRVVKADDDWEIGYSYVKDVFAGLEW